MNQSNQLRFKVPNTLVLLFGMIVVAYLLTLVLPQGSYERVVNDHDREQVVPGSYQAVEGASRLAPTAILTSIPHGFEAAAEIIFFVFLIGGAFGVFRATGAADGAIGTLLKRFGDRPRLLTAGGIILFAVGSSTIGMAEEYLPFVPMLVALTVALGLDAIVAVGVMCIGYAIGYGTALTNPFTVFIAQDIADIQQGSGLALRAVLLGVFLAVGIHHVWSYVRRIQEDPARSLVAGIQAVGGPESVDDYPQITGRQKLVLTAVLAAIALLIVGLKFWGWYLIEMGALFLGLAIVLGLIGRLSVDDTAREFSVGAAELTTTALLIGFARAIQVVLDDGQVVDTIIHGMARPLQNLVPELAAIGMFAMQSVLNFFIPSGSGQAYVTMPLMAPLADLVGVSRQVAVLAYQFGDGFTNILVPTNAVLVGILAMAGVPFDRWLRFVVPFMLKVWILGSIALAIAVSIGFS